MSEARAENTYICKKQMQMQIAHTDGDVTKPNFKSRTRARQRSRWKDKKQRVEAAIICESDDHG